MTEVSHPANRSMPPNTVIPVLAYPDVGAAVTWLCDRFGFSLRWKVGDHRAQISLGDGTVVIIGGGGPPSGDSIMIRIGDLDDHHDRLAAQGVEVTEPQDFPYGERQCTAVDLAGRRWTFSQTIADSDPQSWGAEVGPALG